MKALKKTFVVFALFVLAVLANAAGSHTLTADSNGNVSLAWDDSKRELIYNLLARTGDFSPGHMLVRLDNMPIQVSDGSTYWGSIHIPLEGDIPVLDGKNLKIPNMRQPNAKAIHVDRRWFLVKHQIEIVFYGLNGKGQVNTNHSAWPAVQFTLEPTEAPTAAQSKGGDPLTADQLDAIVKDAFNKGVERQRQESVGDREKLLQQIKDLLDKNNQLEVKLAKAGGLSSIDLERYLPIAWTCNEPVPALREKLAVYSGGHPVAVCEVYEVVTVGTGRNQYVRIWVHILKIASDIDPNRCTVGRPKPQGDK